VPEVFSVVRRAVADQLPAGAPFRAVLDDSLLRRSGLHTPGVGWRRDPLDPASRPTLCAPSAFFRSPLPCGNRGRLPSCALAFLDRGEAAQPTLSRISRALVCANGQRLRRRKPDRKPTPEQVAQYRLDASSSRLSLRAAQQMIQLRQSLDQDYWRPGPDLDTRL